ncbi:unnamed protein product [Prorocentrum cordatum]|uniref:Uncharacterized protein n=1 Tax=Prorocentrum cordatum TaxID=2364126 RepID=A0ABN9XV32_9DINO|nr:unnamed protein product [Polarella glacialis]
MMEYVKEAGSSEEKHEPSTCFKYCVDNFGKLLEVSLVLRLLWVLIIIRELVAKIISAAHYVIFPDWDLEAQIPFGVQHCPKQTRIDAWALGAEVKTAVDVCSAQGQDGGRIGAGRLGAWRRGQALQIQVRSLAYRIHARIAELGAQFNRAEEITGDNAALWGHMTSESSSVYAKKKKGPLLAQSAMLTAWMLMKVNSW